MYAYQSEGVVAEEGANPFLEHLPLDTPVYSYNRQCPMESVFPPSSVKDRFIVVKNFPPDVFSQHEELPRLCDYSRLFQILIIKMSSGPHEDAATNFNYMIMALAQDMSVRRQLRSWGSTRVDTSDRRKMAANGWGPRGPPRGFPTVALEVGFPGPTVKLENDIAWWINGSNGDVRIGITIDIQDSDSIEVKSWTAFEPPPHSNYTTASGRRVFDGGTNDPPPRVVQRVFFKRGRDGAGPTVEGKGITLPFRDVLLDTPGEGEGDFVLTSQKLLEDLAELIWDTIDQVEKMP
ncbi:hypothetical protein CBS147332_3693 [Penicillium roqueforti]|nr:hypothetical protein CBS147332_3693 [Penicillium roqueforti]KAI3117481.1 hypothetical protein CBS147331_3956 [Penicillium roqueforti]